MTVISNIKLTNILTLLSVNNIVYREQVQARLFKTERNILTFLAKTNSPIYSDELNTISPSFYTKRPILKDKFNIYYSGNI